MSHYRSHKMLQAFKTIINQLLSAHILKTNFFVLQLALKNICTLGQDLWTEDALSFS